MALIYDQDYFYALFQSFEYPIKIEKSIYFENYFLHFVGLYNDTIKDGIHGFSGSSKGWKYVELHWVWLMLTKRSTFENYGKPILRFRFISDNINSNKEGWIIDDIVFRGYDISGRVSELKDDKIKAFPNPTNGKVFFEVPEKYKYWLIFNVV